MNDAATEAIGKLMTLADDEQWMFIIAKPRGTEGCRTTHLGNASARIAMMMVASLTTVTAEMGKCPVKNVVATILNHLTHATKESIFADCAEVIMSSQRHTPWLVASTEPTEDETKAIVRGHTQPEFVTHIGAFLALCLAKELGVSITEALIGIGEETNRVCDISGVKTN